MEEPTEIYDQYYDKYKDGENCLDEEIWSIKEDISWEDL